MTTGWLRIAFGDLLSVPLRNGVSPASAGTKPGQVLTLSAVTGSRFLAGEVKDAVFAQEPPPLKRVDSQDFLICRGSGNPNLVGRGRFPDVDLPDVAFPDTVIAARVDRTLVDHRYLERLWLTAEIRDQIDASARTTNGTFKVNQTAVERIELALPPLPEQRRIAAILDAADEVLAQRQASLKLLDSLTEAIFLDMFGDPVSNSAGWPSSRSLGEIAEASSGITVGRKANSQPMRSVPYLAVVNVQDRRLRLATVKQIDATESEIARYRLEPDDLLLTEGGDPDKLGRGTVWAGAIPECIHQNHVFRVRITDPEFEPLFVSRLLASELGRRYFLRSAKQTTGIASINMTQLKDFPLLEPPIARQREYVSRLRAAALAESDLKRHAAQTAHLFASLQHRAFAGQL